MTMASLWINGAFRVLCLLQFIFCIQLYINQLQLTTLLSSLQTGEEIIYRNRRAIIRSAEDDFFEELSKENVSLERNTTDAPLVTPRSSPQKRKKVRLPTEKFVVSTESTTVYPVMIRSSRTKLTGKERKSNRERQHQDERYTRYKMDTHSTSREKIELKHPSPTFLPPFSPAAIHFVGDVSNVTKARHPHYTGNGRIKISGIYTNWRPAHWASKYEADQHFNIKNGKLTIHRGGLYLLYAQIHYSNVQEVNCYRALHNEVTVAQCCSTTSHPDRHEIKANTCSLFTTLFLRPEDKVWLADLHERFVILTEEKSYFGMVQLRDEPKNR